MRIIFFLLLISFNLNAKTSNEKFIDKVAKCSNSIQAKYLTEEKVPLKLVVAQAILESNWGKSRFAKEGNNFFGMRTWDLNKEHMKPKSNPDSKFGLVVYPNLCASVKDYLENINTSEKYYELRRVRSIELSLWDSVDPVVLARFLGNYSEEGKLYTQKVINQIDSLNID